MDTVSTIEFTIISIHVSCLPPGRLKLYEQYPIISTPWQPLYSIVKLINPELVLFLINNIVSQQPHLLPSPIGLCMDTYSIIASNK